MDGSNMVAMPSAPVDTAMTELDQKINQVIDAFDKVSGQIRIVLAPDQDTTESAGPNEPRAPRSALTSGLNVFTDRLELLRRNIYSISDRIEL